MKIMQKTSSGTFYTKHSKWTNVIFNRSASGREAFLLGSPSSGFGFGFFSISWNSRVRVSSRK